MYLRCRAGATRVLEAWARNFAAIWRGHDKTSAQLMDQPALKSLVFGKGRFANETLILPPNFNCRIGRAVNSLHYKQHPQSGPCLVVHYKAAHRLAHGSLAVPPTTTTP